VSPSLGYNGEETALAIYGRNFYPAVHVNTLESSDASFDAQFQAELVSELTGEVVALSAVTLEDYSSLTASVPDGAEPGWYDLVVTAPSGVSSALPHAFEVTDTKATALLFDTSSEVLYGVIGDMITLNFYLADDDGEEVAEPVEVVFQAAAWTTRTTAGCRALSGSLTARGCAARSRSTARAGSPSAPTTPPASR
jgi:hypothetical protein